MLISSGLDSGDSDVVNLKGSILSLPRWIPSSTSSPEIGEGVTSGIGPGLGWSHIIREETVCSSARQVHNEVELFTREDLQSRYKILLTKLENLSLIGDEFYLLVEWSHSRVFRTDPRVLEFISEFAKLPETTCWRSNCSQLSPVDSESEML
jgi:hypothetical protein